MILDRDPIRTLVEMNVTSSNSTDRKEPDEDFSYDDATWVLTSSIVIFTMQTGTLSWLLSQSVNESFAKTIPSRHMSRHMESMTLKFSLNFTLRLSSVSEIGSASELWLSIRIRALRIRLCCTEERSEYFDEKRRGHCTRRSHVLAVRVWPAILQGKFNNSFRVCVLRRSFVHEANCSVSQLKH